MTTHMAIYIGAGTDTFPLEAMKDVNHFIFIDSLPRTEQPLTLTQTPSKIMHNFESAFVGKVHAKMIKRGFYPVINQCQYPSNVNTRQHMPYCIRYETDECDRVCDYYFNTCFPVDIDMHAGLRQQLSDCNTIIIAGHDPHRSLLDMVCKPFIVCCFDGTYYGREVLDDSGVIPELYGSHANHVKEIRYYKKAIHMESHAHMASID